MWRAADMKDCTPRHASGHVITDCNKTDRRDGRVSTVCNYMPWCVSWRYLGSLSAVFTGRKLLETTHVWTIYTFSSPSYLATWLVPMKPHLIGRKSSSVIGAFRSTFDAQSDSTLEWESVGFLHDFTKAIFLPLSPRHRGNQSCIAAGFLELNILAKSPGHFS